MQTELTKYSATNGTSYHASTCPAVVRALESARMAGYTIRVFYGDTSTGKAWADEWHMSGKVGRSMGPIKVPLIVPPGSHGGPAMLDHCIVAIRGPHGWIYRHDNFSVGQWQARAIDESSEMYVKGYRTEVLHDGQVHARFDGPNSLARADRYIAFMTGNRLTR